MAKSNWMQGAVSRPGGLHRALGVPEGTPIPASKLAAAKNSNNPKVRRMASLAGTFAKFRPKKSKSAAKAARQRAAGK